MVVDAISEPAHAFLETDRPRMGARSVRGRKANSFRATHTAAYNANPGEGADIEDSPSAIAREPAVPETAEPDADVETVAEYAASASPSEVSRRVATLADAVDAYASN